MNQNPSLDLCPELKGIKTLLRSRADPRGAPWTYALNSKGLRLEPRDARVIERSPWTYALNSKGLRRMPGRQLAAAAGPGPMP